MSRLATAERTPLRIGFDFDDVLVQTGEATTVLYNQWHGTELTASDWYNFDDMSSRWGTEYFTEAARRVNEIFASREFVETAEPLEGAQEVVEKLQVDGHDLSIITGRPERLRLHTVQLAHRLFPDAFAGESVCFTDHFSPKGKKVTKGEVALLFGNHGYARMYKEENPLMTRVGGWQGVMEFFDAR